MGCFVMIDPATNFTAGAGMIASRVREQDSGTSRQSVSGRIARAARGASSESDAVENVRRILEEILA
jgi:sulfate adenylyltransferase subunit 1 (EFTu-like GTPase family)